MKLSELLVDLPRADEPGQRPTENELVLLRAGFKRCDGRLKNSGVIATADDAGVCMSALIGGVVYFACDPSPSRCAGKMIDALSAGREKSAEQISKFDEAIKSLRGE